MQIRESRLPEPARKSIGALFREARGALSRSELADAIDLEDPTWIQHLEEGPPAPFYNLSRFVRLKRRLGLTWPQILQAAGVWDPEDAAAHLFEE